MQNWSSVEFLFTFKLHITPAELDKLEFWRIESILDEYEKYAKRENDESEKQQGEYEKKYNVNDYKSQMKTPDIKMPQLPSWGNSGNFKLT